MIIAIDGPAGAGKSTIAQHVALRLGFLYIDTGAMYRAVTLRIIEEGIDIKDTAAIVRSARAARIELICGGDTACRAPAVLLDGKDVSAAIRQPRVARWVSDVARIGGVREAMVALQRTLGGSVDCVLDGRDIGTVVFPDADRKFYLDADFRERICRRHKELRGAGQQVSEQDVAADLHNRDTIDSTRRHSPLKKADDAIYVDTTQLSIEEVVEKVLRHIDG